MDRKTFLNRLALGSSGLVLLPATGILQGCEYKAVSRTNITETDVPFLNALAETILPATESSSGAGEAMVGEYIFIMFRDCMDEEGQILLLNGLNELDNRSAAVFSGSFLEADDSQRLSLLNTIQTEATAYNLGQEGSEIIVPHYFDILKGLTISGYFTSEIGMTQAREYLPVPGKFEACIPYSKNQKVWAI